MVKVLIVEDESLLRKDIILTVPWEDFGCNVIGEAHNGKEGRELIRRLVPDIVITDIRMPEEDGIVMIKSLKDLPGIEYIIISGYSEFEYAHQAVKLGVKNYLLKPIDDNELMDTVIKVVEEIRHRQNYIMLQENYSNIVNKNSLMFMDSLETDITKSKKGYMGGAFEYINCNYMKDIGISDVAEHLHISESYLSKLFKAETSFTFVEYLANVRIKKAVELLKTSSIKIYEAANMVGFKDYRYFSMIFKKMVGISPTEYKRHF